MAYITINRCILLSLLLLAASCKSRSDAKKIALDFWNTDAQGSAARTALSDKVMQLTYIGCGGFLLQTDGQAILIDPYFSNADVFRHPLRPLVSDTTLIDSFFQKHLSHPVDTAKKIQTILISHSHHDHLGDLPAILRRNLAENKLQIVGNQGVRQMIEANDLLRSQLSFIPIDSLTKITPTKSFTFETSNQRLRITAVVSEHAPHVFGFKAPGIGGKITSKNPSKTFFGYKEGATYNFMIDFLNEKGQVAYRIFSSAGAAANAPTGIPSDELLQQHGVDLLLLCAASYTQVKGYPDSLIRLLHPKAVLLAHWEDFFTPIPKLLQKPRTVPMTDIPAFVKIVKQLMAQSHIEGRPILLHPLSSIEFRF